MTFNDSLTPHLRRIEREFQILQSKQILIGIQGDEGSEILMIAHVHEYGAVIHPKQAQNLCIPINKKSYGKSPRDFKDIFFITSKAGHLFAAVPKAGKRGKKSGDQFEVLFLLLKSVTIPERSFIRAGFDNNKNRLEQVAQDRLMEIIHGRQTAETALEYIGGQAVSFIREYIEESSNFKPKGGIERARAPSWAGSPLVVTGKLRNAITWKVEDKT